jgi:hypothetical protein
MQALELLSFLASPNDFKNSNGRERIISEHLPIGVGVPGTPYITHDNN